MLNSLADNVLNSLAGSTNNRPVERRSRLAEQPLSRICADPCTDMAVEDRTAHAVQLSVALLNKPLAVATANQGTEPSIDGCAEATAACAI